MKIMLLENLEFELTFSFTAHVGVEIVNNLRIVRLKYYAINFSVKKKLPRLSQVYTRIKGIFVFQLSRTVLCNFATVLSSSSKIRSLLKYDSELWNLPLEVF